MNDTNHSNKNNNDEKALVITRQSTSKTHQIDSKSDAPANQKRKVKGKKSGKYAMIQCKTFVFKPSNNGVINFGYKCMFDEEVMKEAERAFEEEKKAKKENEKKNEFTTDGNADTASDDTTDLGNADTVADGYDDESDQRRRKQPTKSEAQGMNNSKIVVKSKDLDPTGIKQEQIQKDQHQQQQQQPSSRQISVPRRRRSSVPPSLPSIKEETLSEMDAAERERWFFEDFCGGVLPPPEELDDWSEPPAPAPALFGPAAVVYDEKSLREKLQEIQKLGFRKVYDAQGNKTILLTSEAKEKLLESEEFREYVKKVKSLEKVTGKEVVEKILKVEIVPNKAALKPAVKQSQSSPLSSSSVSIDAIDVATSKISSSFIPPETIKTKSTSYIPSAGVIETPIKTNPKTNAKEKEELKTEKQQEEKDKVSDIASKEESVQPTKRVNTRQQPPVDLSSFKRRRI